MVALPASPSSPTPARAGSAVDLCVGELDVVWTALRGGRAGSAALCCLLPYSPGGRGDPGGGEIAAVDPPLSLMKFKFV